MKQLCIVGMFLAVFAVGFTQMKENIPDEKKPGTTKGKIVAKEISYAKDVMPVFHKYCLPCHTEDEMNPSQLYLDSYQAMMGGGKHGIPILAGRPDSSILVVKLSFHPPFGDPMPLKRKTPFPDDTLRILREWILQGAKNN